MVLWDDTVSAFEFLYRQPLMVSLLQLILSLLGLFLPGWLVARSLRMPAAWAAAMPLSALIICQSVVVLACLGWLIEFWRVAVLLAVVGVVAVASWPVTTRAGRMSLREWVGKWSRVEMLLLALIAAVVVIFAWRTAREPLSSFDTLFRWEWLARLLLSQQTLNFYPPRSAEDFAIYYYPDGVPPLVAAVYWWLYAGFGHPYPPITAIAVVAQLISLFGLVAAAIRERDANSGLPGVALLAGTPLLITGVAIGQETGYTAIAVAGQLAATFAALRRYDGRGTAFAAGLFAGVGALSREYGPALILIGAVSLVSKASGRRLLPWFFFGALPAAAWFIRSWALTGNPVYSIPTVFGLAANAVHAEILACYRNELSLLAMSAQQWREVAWALSAGAGPLVALAALQCVRGGPHNRALVAGSLLCVVLWAASVCYTAGGVVYSLRVLAPAFTVLAVAAGGGAARIAAIGRSEAGWAPWMRCAFVAACVPGFIAAAMHPFDVSRIISERQWQLFWQIPLLSTQPDPLAGSADLIEIAERLEASPLPSCRILTDNLYLPIILHRRASRFQATMVWSPAVDFLYDGSMPASLSGELLGRDAIHLAMISPRFINFRCFLSRYPLYREQTHWKPLVWAKDWPPDEGVRMIAVPQPVQPR
ncbi:hypothetical protein LBMAG47_32060 [Planctomycetia bacterium]|nr:hypothetical protein LBMAG47_32060 [Planctomycetia bacterium]